MISKNSKIYIAGHKGMVGFAIYKTLKKKGYKNLIVADRKSLDLRNQLNTFNFLKRKKPDVIFIASAKVGGILENQKYGADFIVVGRPIYESASPVTEINNIIENLMS